MEVLRIGKESIPDSTLLENRFEAIVSYELVKGFVGGNFHPQHRLFQWAIKCCFQYPADHVSDEPVEEVNV